MTGRGGGDQDRLSAGLLSAGLSPGLLSPAARIEELEKTVPRVPERRQEPAWELERTVLRSAATDRAFVVRVTDGASTIVRRVGRTLYVGRSPALDGGRAVPEQLLAIGGGDPALAATHLQLSVNGSRLYARDLGSPTGAIVAPPAGSTFRLETGARVALEAGSRLRIGDRVTVAVQEAEPLSPERPPW